MISYWSCALCERILRCDWFLTVRSGATNWLADPFPLVRNGVQDYSSKGETLVHCSGGSGILKRGFQCARVWSHKARELREALALGGLPRGGHVPPSLVPSLGTRLMFPPEKCLISDVLRSLLVPFWGETARVGQPTANLVIVLDN